MRLIHFPKQHIFRLLTLLWLAVIFSLSLQDGTQSGLTSGLITKAVGDVLTQFNIVYQVSTLSFIIRKAAHFTEYAILAFFALNSGKLLKNLSWYQFVFIIPWLDEGLQTFIPGRAGSIVDVGIDTLGIISIWIVFKLYLMIRKPVS